MGIKYLTGVVCACLSIMSFSANAVLLERLGGLAYYDTEANLTWLADANYAQTSGYVSDGLMSWGDASAWVADLNVAGVTGWRLPDTLQPDASCNYQSVGYSWGYNCSGGEMGNMFYSVLGGSEGSSITTTHNTNYDLFSNIQSFRYWSATDYILDSGYAFNFYMNDGYQGSLNKGSSIYSWAVHSGDVGAVPLPAAVWLFGSGLLGLIGVARRKT